MLKSAKDLSDITLISYRQAEVGKLYNVFKRLIIIITIDQQLIKL
jgi:hypothetical protein